MKARNSQFDHGTSHLSFFIAFFTYSPFFHQRTTTALPEKAEKKVEGQAGKREETKILFLHKNLFFLCFEKKRCLLAKKI